MLAMEVLADANPAWDWRESLVIILAITFGNCIASALRIPNGGSKRTWLWLFAALAWGAQVLFTSRGNGVEAQQVLLISLQDLCMASFFAYLVPRKVGASQTMTCNSPSLFFTKGYFDCSHNLSFLKHASRSVLIALVLALVLAVLGWPTVALSITSAILFLYYLFPLAMPDGSVKLLHSILMAVGCITWVVQIVISALSYSPMFLFLAIFLGAFGFWAQASGRQCYALGQQGQDSSSASFRTQG